LKTIKGIESIKNTFNIKHNPPKIGRKKRNKNYRNWFKNPNNIWKVQKPPFGLRALAPSSSQHERDSNMHG